MDETPALFSKRICNENNENQIFVGAAEEYIPVCRKHFNL
jgi:thymidine kinase